MTARGDLVRRCRELERAFIRLKAQGRNTDVGIIWAQQWASALLDTRTPAAMYETWIEQQEQRVLRLVRDSLGVSA
jgi:hypothetical protein